MTISPDIRRSIENAVYKRAADLAKFHARQCEREVRTGKHDDRFWSKIKAAHWRIIEQGIGSLSKYPGADGKTRRGIENAAYKRAAGLAKYHVRYWESEVRNGKRDDRFWNKARAAHWRIIAKSMRELAEQPEPGEETH